MWRCSSPSTSSNPAYSPRYCTTNPLDTYYQHTTLRQLSTHQSSHNILISSQHIFLVVYPLPPSRQQGMWAGGGSSLNAIEEPGYKKPSLEYVLKIISKVKAVSEDEVRVNRPFHATTHISSHAIHHIPSHITHHLPTHHLIGGARSGGSQDPVLPRLPAPLHRPVARKIPDP